MPDIINKLSCKINKTYIFFLFSLLFGRYDVKRQGVGFTCTRLHVQVKPTFTFDVI